MKRIIFLMALLALIAFQTLAAQSTLRRVYQDLDVDVWTDRDDGSNYYEGDDITVYFRASQDCYVTLYDLDTRGNINLIFPSEPGGSNLVHADEIYMIPERGSDYTLTLEGPPGNEHIQMVASTDYYPVPYWQGPVSVYDKEWGFKYDGDNEDFLNKINRKYFSGDNVAYDHVSFYVAPKYYYKPVVADCSGDCGRVYIDYPNGCEVYVDGSYFGIAPLYVPAIFVGRHRVTVYWSSSIVYNDWIFVDPFDPFFVFTRSHYVYNYCYDHWYRHHDWDRYYDGPSRYKYKSGDVYTYTKPKARRGYEIVENDHAKYTKSKAYVAEKETRISKFKETYGYDAKAKTYTTTKDRPTDESVAKKYYNGGAYEKGIKRGADDKGAYEKGRQGDKPVGGKWGEGNRGEKKAVEGNKEQKRQPADAAKKQSDSQSDKKGKYYTPEVKPKSEGGTIKPGTPESKPKSGDSGAGKPNSSDKKNKYYAPEARIKLDGGWYKPNSTQGRQRTGDSGGGRSAASEKKQPSYVPEARSKSAGSNNPSTPAVRQRSGDSSGGKSSSGSSTKQSDRPSGGDKKRR